MILAVNGLRRKLVSRKISGHRFRISLLIFTLLVSIYLFLHSSIFNVDRIEVQGNDKVSREEAIALSGLATGINIFEMDGDLSSKAIETHPMVKKVDIVRQLPRTLVINIIERQIWAVIPYKGVFLCIDDTGVCFDKLNNIPIHNYPIITLDQMPEYVGLGQVVNNQATDMVRSVWQSISDSEHQRISEFHYLNEVNALKIYTVNGTEIRFGNLERLEEKAKTLTQVIQIETNFKKQGKDVLEYIDMRFKGEPVVKTRT
jgi:cell division protein FtsQ